MDQPALTHSPDSQTKRDHIKNHLGSSIVCISRMYVTEYLDCRVEVKYISAHSSHDLGTTELPYLPLPKGVKEEVAIKLSLGIPPERIMEGKCNEK